MAGSGIHLCIYGATLTLLPVARVERFLRHLPRLMGLHRISEPLVVQQDGGLCGIVIVAESHVSVHTRHCAVWVDVFSCIGLDVPVTERAVVRLLGLTRHRTTVIERPMPSPQGLLTQLLEA